MKIVAGIIIFIIATIWILIPKAKQIPVTEIKPSSPPTPTVQIERDFFPPLPNAAGRVTKKTFGMYITPKNSPVQPERFSGYHTGTDFEVTPEEINQIVTVNTICTGKLLVKEYVSGYGGVAVQACTYQGLPITVIYGHVKLDSIVPKKGDLIEADSALGILGVNKSAETDGERKHLHLGIHPGTEINIRGYVSSADQLKGWMNPCLLVCN